MISTCPSSTGDHVTDDAGTGFVHTAPGHGREDFDVWTSAATQQMLREQRHRYARFPIRLMPTVSTP